MREIYCLLCEQMIIVGPQFIGVTLCAECFDSRVDSGQYPPYDGTFAYWDEIHALLTSEVLREFYNYKQTLMGDD